MKAASPALLVTAFLGLAPPAALAQPPASLVADLDVTEERATSGTSLSTRAILGNVLFFVAADPAHGTELWRTDGTPEGTRLLKDLCPGPCGSVPLHLTVLGGRLYFTAWDGVFGTELWATDGTERGTRLVRDICPGPCSAFSLSSLTVLRLGEHLYFAADDGSRGFELWRTDGSREGTELVSDLCAGECSSSPRPLMAGDGHLLFLSNGELGTAPLWATDGTAEGTRQLLLHCPGCFPGLPFGDGLFFLSRTHPQGLELWRTDGTPEGTGLFTDLCPGPCDGLTHRSLAVYREELYFAGRTVDGRVGDLFRTSGSPGDVERVLGFPQVSGPEHLAVAGGELCFTAGGPGIIRELFCTDGSAAGTTMVRSPGQVGPSEVVTAVVPASGRLFFTVDRRQLWAAGPLGAVHLLTLPPPDGGLQSLYGLTPVGARLFFAGREAETGLELWASDGSPDGTGLVREIGRDEGSSRPRPVVALGGRVLFAAEDDRGATGLWTSDGSEAGTVPLGVGPSTAFELFPVGEELIYSPTGDEPAGTAGLWRSDGTPGGTRLIHPAPAGVTELVEVGGRLFFSAETEDGREPWVSDFTQAGTFQLRDIYPGFAPFPDPPLPPASSDPRGFIALGSQVLFAATRENDGRELWITDGTSGGTRLLKDICPGECSSSPADLVPFVGEVFFTADDGQGRAIWRSDGTPEGTVVLSPGRHSDVPHGLTVLGRRLLFFARLEPGYDVLLSNNGTFGGTGLVAYLTVDGRHSFVTDHLQVGGRLFFVAANEATGPELWVTDGTPPRTRLVQETLPGPQGSYPTALTAVGDLLLFSAEDPFYGREPWATNGTAEGTRLLANVAPGRVGSLPDGFARTGTRLFFAADDGVHGRELWTVDAFDVCIPSDEALCLLDGRFEVRVRWRNQHAGGSEGIGHAVPFEDPIDAGQTGFFWFFEPENVELAVKVLDGRRINGYFWVFHGALSDVEYTIEVRDRLTGALWTYTNPPGNYCGQGDIQAFQDLAGVAVPPEGSPAEARLLTPLPGDAQTGSCTSTSQALCLLDGRFRVEVSWRNQHAGGIEGVGRAIPGTDKSGYFWFFSPGNLELMVKMLDGREVNGKFWVFYGGLSDVEYQLTVTDTETGDEAVYHNPPREICGLADVGALDG